MRISALFLVFLLCIGHVCIAQDIITQRNGGSIRAKVLKVKQYDIEYKLYDNQDGPLHTISKSDVSVITYPNGTTDEFKDLQNNYSGGISLAERGRMDAAQYYDGYKPAMTGGIISGVAFGYGFISAAIIYATPPKYENLHFPYPELMDKYEYSDAYMRKACQIKRAKTAEGFGIGFGILATLIIGITVASAGH